jgi:hypothetical protein
MQFKDSKQIIKYEFHNYQHIILYFSGGGFWKASMNSALVLKNQINPRLNIHFHNHGFYGRSIPYISFRQESLERLTTMLFEQHGITLNQTEPKYRVYKLPVKIEKAQFKDWNNDIELKQSHADNLLTPKLPKPEIYATILDLASSISNLCQNMRADIKTIYAQPLMDNILQLQQCYFNEDYPKMTAVLSQITFLIHIAFKNNSITPEKSIQIGDKVINLDKQIDKINSARRQKD